MTTVQDQELYTGVNEDFADWVELMCATIPGTHTCFFTDPVSARFYAEARYFAYVVSYVAAGGGDYSDYSAKVTECLQWAVQARGFYGVDPELYEPGLRRIVNAVSGLCARYLKELGVE